MNTFKKAVVIVAGGSGTRMGADVPKQFLELGGLPILMRTITKFYQYDTEIKIVLVLPISHFQYWQTLVQKHKFDIHHTLVAGGETRFQSVKNGINSLQNIDLVAIHDGVRPFVSPSIIKNSFQLAAQKGSAIAAVPSKDSLRLVQKDGSSQALDRTLCYLMQTPQVFQYPIISKALQQPELPIFTDDASVVEYDGVQVYLSEGSYQNIKITTKEDLILAEAFIKNGY